MFAGVVLIAALLNLAPVPPSTSPVTNTAASPSPEGPANDPFVVAWQRRDRRLRIARNTTAGVAGASLVGLLTAEALGSEPPLLIGLGACLAVSLLGTAAAGGIRREHLQDRPSALRPPPPTLSLTPNELRSGRIDPRRDIAWARRDRRLTQAMIGTGVVLGVAVVGAGISLAALFAPGNDTEDATGPFVAAISLGAIAGIMALPFTALTVARGVYRRPLRRWRMQAAGSGLALAF